MNDGNKLYMDSAIPHNLSDLSGEDASEEDLSYKPNPR